MIREYREEFTSTNLVKVMMNFAIEIEAATSVQVTIMNVAETEYTMTPVGGGGMPDITTIISQADQLVKKKEKRNDEEKGRT